MRNIEIAKEAQELCTYAAADLAEGGRYIQSYTVDALLDFWLETFWAEVEEEEPTPEEEEELRNGFMALMEEELVKLGVPR